MLYEVYQKKINRIAFILARIVRLLPLILTVLAVTVSLIGGYMLMKGMVFSMACPTQTVYGDSLNCRSRVFLSDVHYEHCAIGSEEWTDGIPVAAGQYRIRAVTENVFGNPRYGKPTEITILPKEITVGVSDQEVIYGGDLTIVGQTVSGDRLVCDRYVFVRTSELSEELFAQYDVTPDTAHIRILDVNGNDVTASYRISAQTASVKIEKLQITVTVPDASKVYDGEALTSERFDVTQGSLCVGDRLEGTFTDSIISVGSVDNKPTFRFWNGDGEDVTEYYAVNYVYGTLTVEKKPVVITTGSMQTVYNDQAVSNGSYTVDADHSPILGHTVVTDGEWLSFTEVGSHLNVMDFHIKDSFGTDQTANYDLQITDGVILISPRPLNVTTESAEWVYDGKTHSANEYTADGLLAWHTVHIYLGMEVTDVGEYKNEILFVIRNASGADVTSNYEIVGNYGICKITPRPLTFVTGSEETVYNGAPQSANTFYQEGLAADVHYIEFISWTEETEANVYTNIMEFIIRDITGRDVTFNYDITRTFGTLTIKPRPIHVTTADQTWIYDGNEHGQSSYNVSGLVDGHSTTLLSAAKIRDVGQIPNEISIDIFDENGQRVTDNYELTASCGTLKVDPRPITVRTDGGTWIYDSMEHRISSYSIVSTMGLVDGERLIIDGTVSVIDVIRTENKPIAFDIVRYTVAANTESSLSNYEVSWEYGILEILPRPITLKPLDQSKIYDAKQLLANAWEYTADSEYKLIPWHTVSLTYVGELTDVGYISSSITSVQIMDSNQNGRDVTFNYQIVLEEGVLEIFPRPISLKPVDQSKVYDGTPLIADAWEYTANSQYNLVSWHLIHVTYEGSLTDVGKIPSYISSVQILDPERDMRDVTSNYEIELLEGTLEIFPRQIFIQPVDRSDVYNAKPLVAIDWKYADYNQYKLAFGHTLKLTYDGAQTDVGKSASHISSYQVLDPLQGGKDVTENYQIICLEGTLEVIYRPIWIKPKDQAKKYDGTPLYPNGWEYAEDNEFEIVRGQTLRADYFGSQTEIGMSESYIANIQIFEKDKDVSHNYLITADPGMLYIYDNVPDLPEAPRASEQTQY